MKKFFQTLSLIVLAFSTANAQYCTSNATSIFDEEITNVTFSNINNTTTVATPLVGSMGPAVAGQPNLYADFTSIAPASVLAGQAYPFSVTIGSNGTTNFLSGVKIFIDYNQNSLFTDPGEEVYYSGVGNAINSVPPGTVSGTITIPITASPGLTRMRVIDREGGQGALATIVPCGNYGYGETEDYLVNIIPPVPCSGKPSAGTIVPTGPLAACPSNAIPIYVVGSSAMSNIIYQWQTSVNNGATWTNIVGATNLSHLIPAATPSAWYRLMVTCLNNFQRDTSDTLVVNVLTPTYVPLPYTQSFENWADYCSNNDAVLDNHWNNTPAVGNNSWRRNDEGAFGNWVAAGTGSYTPPSSDLLHSARFHSYNTSLTGNLDLYLNTAGNPNSTLLFDFINKTGFDDLDVSISTNGGTSFGASVLNLTNSLAWQTNSISLPIASPTTIVRFTATGDFGDDIGLDNIRVVPPCNNMPNAGTVKDTTVCPNRDFTLTTIGSSLAGGLDFEWQSAPTATGPWTVIGNTISNSIITQISVNTFFRVIVRCTSTGQADTTNVEDITLKDFYYCYCDNTGSNSSSDEMDLGNLQLKKNTNFLINNLPLGINDTINNLSAINSYTNFQYLSTIPTLFMDSAYIVNCTAITSNSWTPFGSSRVFIDYNRDGNFDPISEVAGGGTLNNSVTSNIFTVPNNAQQGITGMRVIVSDAGAPGGILPCNFYFEGETEDYLVYLSLPPCAPPSNPGIAHISDSIICAGYNVTVTDTTHTSLAAYNGLSTIWQQSATGLPGSFVDIAGATGDTYTFIASTPIFHRMKIICKPGTVVLDSAYSNVVQLNLYPSFGCYPASASLGGNADSNDIGAFLVGNYSFITGGPHLGNPAAVRIRTDFSAIGATTLYADSTYEAAIFSILKPLNHADSRITVFIDYNNNGIYDIPTERVYIGQSGISTYYLPFSFKTIATPALNVPTGMRVILNNNVLPNGPSDQGVGLYTSGETEDYLVKFIPKPITFPTAISNTLELKNIAIYPNPTTGLVYLDISSINLKNATITVSNIMGQELISNTFNDLGNEFHTTLDLSKFAKGTYLIKVASDKGNTMQKVTLQ